MTVDVHEPGPWERRLAGGVVRSVLYRRRPVSDHVPARDRLLPRVRFQARDGAQLVGLHHPAKEPRGIVVLAHPDKRLGKHWWSKNGIITWLNENGLDAFAFDFAVYGESHGGNVYLHDHVIAAVHEARRIDPSLPVHLWGVSIGSYAALNAAPELPELESLILESPYPTFRAWYQATGARLGASVVRLLEGLFPATYARIDAGRNIQGLDTPAILLAATRTDTVTPVALTRQLAAAAPPHARYVECDDVPHLGLFAHAPTYRAAILEALLGRESENGTQTPPRQQDPSAPGSRTLKSPRHLTTTA